MKNKTKILILSVVLTLPITNVNASDANVDAYFSSPSASNVYDIIDGRIYKDGKLFTGKLVMQSKSSHKKFTREHFHGLQTYYYENGNIRYESNWINGKRHGPFTNWREDGSKELERNFYEDKKHGLLTEYYPSGIKQTEANFVNGKLHGLWTHWDKNGRIKDDE